MAAEKPEKLLDEITLKMDIDQKRKLFGLAATKGTTASEIVRTMVERFISENEREFLAMKDIFEGKD